MGMCGKGSVKEMWGCVERDVGCGEGNVRCEV